jgi:phosphopentomutase
VLQIAAHEEHFGLERLYEICEAAYELVKPYNIGRVIARPFKGEDGNYTRTSNRHDYAVPPPAPTLLDHVKDAGGEVIALGKISDIFAGQGVSRVVKGADNMALFDALLKVSAEASDGSLTFVNFVDFDMHFGHRRDIAGYSNALHEMDARLPEFMATLKEGDLVVLTADHGCDPTWPGSDHTREHIPMLFFGPGVAPRDLGISPGFSDIGQTLAHHLGVAPLAHGTSLL